MNYSELSDQELLDLRSRVDDDISKYHNFQLCRKIQLNSAYGSIGTPYCRYYDTKLAEAITLTGQVIIQFIADEINVFLNTAIGSTDIDYVIASDTDSVMLNMEAIVNKFGKNKTKTEIIDYINEVCVKIMTPFIRKQFEKMAKLTNANSNKIIMEREVIADIGIWTAKKRYMLNVWDVDGVRYKEPKQKIMGIETTRSSTPEVVRKRLKDCISLILNNDEEDLIKYVATFKKEFYSLTPEEIAFPRSVNGLKKYTDKNQIYKKATPIAVKGSLLYNHYLSKLKLTKKYNKINEGEKIKFIYLKKPNPLSGAIGADCVIAFPGKLPSEFDVGKFIDYALQFEKTFLDPLETILNVISWNYEEKASLETLFR